MKKFIKDRGSEHIDVIRELLEGASCVSALEIICLKAAETLEKGGKLIFCGNGGSAADSLHLAAEFVGRFRMERPGLPAISLAANMSAITAIGNDYSYDDVFSRQVEALGSDGDMLIGLTTSGNSANVLRAIEKGREMDIFTAGFSGGNRSARIVSLADACLCVPSSNTPRVQEAHILAGHILCEYVENRLYGKG